MRKSIFRYKRFWILAIFLALIGFLLTLRPIRIILQTAPNMPEAVSVSPALPDVNLAEWEQLKSSYLKTFEQSVYGSFPSALELELGSTKLLKTTAQFPDAKIQHSLLEVRNPKNDQTAIVDFVLISPIKPERPRGLILTQNFCPNHDVLPISDMPEPVNAGNNCPDGGVFSRIMLYFFGRYIVSPPFETILSEGYAIGLMHPPQFITDDAETARNQLDNFFSNYEETSRPGALMSWAALSVKTADLLKDDFSSIITMGHSRYGKTALLAAVFSDNIDAVISHQSGTGGASLFRGNPGETLADITGSYPHWFGAQAPSFAANPAQLPLDQHYLLALIAPKPVFLGNAQRDVWSDPNGAFQAAHAASAIYELYSQTGMTAEQLDQFRPDDIVTYWIRPGTHGITEEDWPAFLEFLNRHF